MAEGKPLDKVLAIFPPSLHGEIEVYYCQAVESGDDQGGMSKMDKSK